MGSVTKLEGSLNENTGVSDVIAMLEEVLENLKSSEWPRFTPNKAIVVFLNDERESESPRSEHLYQWNWVQTGMRMSEAVALTRMMETDFLKEMGVLSSSQSDE